MDDEQGQGEQAVAARPAAPVRPVLPRSAASFAAQLPELTQRSGDVRAAASELDHRQVRRAYRAWSDWIEIRGRHKPIALLVAFDLAEADAATDKAIALLRSTDSPVIEFAPAGQAGASDEPVPWPREYLAVLPGGGPLDLRVLVISDLAALRQRPDLVNLLRRDCVAALIEQALYRATPSDLFDTLPAATFMVERGTAATRLVDPVKRHITVGADWSSGLGAVIDTAIPSALRGPSRAMGMIGDLALLAETVAEHKAALALPASGGTITQAGAVGLDLAGRQARLAAAKVDLVGAIKVCIAGSRTARQDTDAGQVAAHADHGQFREFIERFKPESQWPLSQLTVREEKRAWWQGSALETFGLGVFFNRKARHKLAGAEGEAATVASLIEPYRDNTLLWLGRFLQNLTGELQASVEAIETAYGDLAAATRVRWPIRISRRAVCGEQSQQDASPQAAAIRNSVNEAFAGFSSKEQASFYVDVDEKGVIGQLGEARSGVFGIFFLLLFFARPLQTMTRTAPPSAPPTDCSLPDHPVRDAAGNLLKLCKNADPTFFAKVGEAVQYLVAVLTVGMAVGTLIAFVVNRLMRERKLRVALVERFEGRIEDLRNRTAELVGRTITEVLTRFEQETEDFGAIAEANLARMVAQVQAQQDEDRGGPKRGGPAAPLAARTTMPLGRVSLQDECRKLEAKMREAYLAEACKPVPT